MTGQINYTTRQAAYDLRKIRGKQLINKPGRSRRYHLPPDAARTIAALLTLRDHVITPKTRFSTSAGSAGPSLKSLRTSLPVEQTTEVRQPARLAAL
jgi:hypothetical protein